MSTATLLTPQQERFVWTKYVAAFVAFWLLPSVKAAFASLLRKYPSLLHTHTHTLTNKLSALCMIQTYVAPLSQTGDNKYT